MDESSPAPDTSSPRDEPPSAPELDRAVAVMMANVDRLDELALDGVEPATTFGWR